MSLILIIILLLYCDHLGKKYGSNRDTVSGLSNNSVWMAKLIWKHPIMYHIGYMFANIVSGFIVLIVMVFMFIINLFKGGWPYIRRIFGNILIRLNRK